MTHPYGYEFGSTLFHVKSGDEADSVIKTKYSKQFSFRFMRTIQVKHDLYSFSWGHEVVEVLQYCDLMSKKAERRIMNSLERDLQWFALANLVDKNIILSGGK